MPPAISVVICTHNPDEKIFDWTLDGLAGQTLAPSSFEAVVVDNRSRAPLEAGQLQRGRGFRLRVVSESRPGQLFARCKGIQEAVAPLLVFMDDDNRLAPDYLEQALLISREHPEAGAFGGICRPVFEAPVAGWKERLLPYLAVRDHGPERIVSRSGEWGKWDPIGAGMVIRRDAAELFVRMVESDREAQRLGRVGKGLMSGDDTLLARAAWRLGYACAYEPELKLEHFLKSGRFRTGALARILLGHGRSYVVLQRVLGRPAGRLHWQTPLSLAACYLSRIRHDGLRAGTIVWLWDLGRTIEVSANKNADFDRHP
jgi:glycosyltransferase involved in cell wall biosynthesis